MAFKFDDFKTLDISRSLILAVSLKLFSILNRATPKGKIWEHSISFKDTKHYIKTRSKRKTPNTLQQQQKESTANHFILQNSSKYDSQEVSYTGAYCQPIIHMHGVRGGTGVLPPPPSAPGKSQRYRCP